MNGAIHKVVHGIGAHSLTPMTHNYHPSAVVSCIGNWTDGCATAKTEHTQDEFQTSRDVWASREGKLSFGPTWWRRRLILTTTIGCLGVLVDSDLTFAVHVQRFTGRCFYQIRRLRTVRCRARSVEAARTLVHAFVVSRVDCIFGSTCAVHRHPYSPF